MNTLIGRFGICGYLVVVIAVASVIFGCRRSADSVKPVDANAVLLHYNVHHPASYGDSVSGTPFRLEANDERTMFLTKYVGSKGVVAAVIKMNPLSVTEVSVPRGVVPSLLGKSNVLYAIANDSSRPSFRFEDGLNAAPRQVPISGGDPHDAADSDVLVLERDDKSIEFWDATRKEKGGRIALYDMDPKGMLVAGNRVAVFGRDNRKKSCYTSLYSIPELKEISRVDEQANKKFSIPSIQGKAAPKRIGSNLFACQTQLGRWQVCQLSDGAPVYSIGEAMPLKEWWYTNNLYSGVLLNIIGGKEYVDASGRVAWIRDDLKNRDRVFIGSCDAKTGAMAKEVLGNFKAKYYGVTKVAGQMCVWVASEAPEGHIILNVYSIDTLNCIASMDVGTAKLVSCADDKVITVDGRDIKVFRMTVSDPKK